MLNRKLDNYLDEDYYPFHMPSHKRDEKLNKSLGYTRDLTEIEGFDNLNNPKDIFKIMENSIARIYDVKDTIISTNGSTCGILSTIRAVTSTNKNILIQRSSHKSIFNSVELFDLSCDYIDVKLNEVNAVTDIDKDDFLNKIKTNDYAAVIITSPSYEGYYLDLDYIYNICKDYNTKLILDMAHGSHLLLNNSYNKSFDVAITSFHKNLSALTPAAAVLINDMMIDYEIRRNMAIFQTSSPSYLILQSIDEMIEKFEEFYDLNEHLKCNLDTLYNTKLKHLKLIDSYNKDKTKILISTVDTNIDGKILQNLLKIEKIEIEMAYPSYVLLISSIFDTDEGFKRLINALKKIDAKIKINKKNNKFSYKIPNKSFRIKDAIYKDKISIDIDKSIGKICGEFIYAYPPGIPILLPGEVIDQDIIDNINLLKKTSIDLNIENEILTIN